MGEWHRENPDLVGTEADPWMQNPTHRAAHNELSRMGLIPVTEQEDEEFDQITRRLADGP